MIAVVRAQIIEHLPAWVTPGSKRTGVIGIASATPAIKKKWIDIVVDAWARTITFTIVKPGLRYEFAKICWFALNLDPRRVVSKS